MTHKFLITIYLLQPHLFPLLDGGDDGGGGGSGMFDKALEQIRLIAQDAWGFLIGLFVIVALLGALWLSLQGTAGAAFGGSRMTGMAIIGAVGLIVLVIFVFLVLPEMGGMLEGLQPDPPF